MTNGFPPDITGAGEYGATTVQLTRDGQMIRMAFGRNTAGGKSFFGATMLSPEAARELKEQLESLMP